MDNEARAGLEKWISAIEGVYDIYDAGQMIRESYVDCYKGEYCGCLLTNIVVQAGQDTLENLYIWDDDNDGAGVLVKRYLDALGLPNLTCDLVPISEYDDGDLYQWIINTFDDGQSPQQIVETMKSWLASN